MERDPRTPYTTAFFWSNFAMLLMLSGTAALLIENGIPAPYVVASLTAEGVLYQGIVKKIHDAVTRGSIERWDRENNYTPTEADRDFYKRNNID